MPSPSPYMDTLIKKVEVLFSQLKPILPDDQIQVSEVSLSEWQLIFGSILSELTLFFISRFESINPSDVPLLGRERLNKDEDMTGRIVGDVMCLLAVFRGKRFSDSLPPRPRYEDGERRSNHHASRRRGVLDRCIVLCLLQQTHCRV